MGASMEAEQFATKEETMPELNTLEEKLGEVTGLATAAVDATKKVEGMLDDDSADLAEALRKMREEAEETEPRCRALGDPRQGQREGRRGRHRPPGRLGAADPGTAPRRSPRRLTAAGGGRGSYEE